MIFERFDYDVFNCTPKKRNNSAPTLRASAANFWLRCSAYPFIAGERYDTVYADDGHKAHEEASQALFQAFAKNKVTSYFCSKADFGFALKCIDAIKNEDAKIFVEEVARNFIYHGEMLYIEETLKPSGGSFDLALGGTPDAVVIDTSRNIVTIYDLKSGYQSVSPERNEQLGCYQYLIEASKKLPPRPKGATYSYVYVIVQEGEVKTWGVDENWYAALKKDINKSIDMFENNEWHYHKDMKFCEGCYSRQNCPGYFKKVEEAFNEFNEDR